MSITYQSIELYKSLFRGREDIYAVRWEKDGKSGYMPAYEVDWTNYEKHKAQGGAFRNYKDKKHLHFDSTAIQIHLEGFTMILQVRFLQNLNYFLIESKLLLLVDCLKV